VTDRRDAKPDGRGPLQVDRRLVFGLTVAALAIVVLSGLGLWSVVGPGRAGGAPGSILVAIRGDADATSEPFHVREGWQIEWENTGQYFSYTIHGDVEFGQVIAQNGPGSGITSPVPVGEFWIEVASQGPWTVTVIQGG
jgi:hypothetical protein